MSTSGRKLRLNSVSVSLGCSSCKKPKLSLLIHPKHKPKPKPHSLYFSSSTTSSCKTNATVNDTSSATISSPKTWETDTRTNNKIGSRTVRGFGRVGGQSLAVEKESDDPYLDFRHSMLQMILEKEIYSKDDLKELLSCFLQLNSPYHHEVIVRAFTEIWSGVFSLKKNNINNNASSKLQFGCRSRD
ncbi:transcription repressor OFP6-like [Mangifera indica]|uniref:transcription repressor OFP6-like n=1 Tax=Mangifera indica TaxID=29780 RepID=UPI001CFA4829|nr:transcription repressor OFP6-like [Mangifera indica]